MNNPDNKPTSKIIIETLIVAGVGIGVAILLNSRVNERDIQPAAAGPDNRLPTQPNLLSPENKIEPTINPDQISQDLIRLFTEAEQKYKLPKNILKAIALTVYEGQMNGKIDLRLGMLGVVPSEMDGELDYRGIEYHTNDCAPGQNPLARWDEICRADMAALAAPAIQVDYAAWLLGTYMNEGGSLRDGLELYLGNNEELIASVLAKYDKIKHSRKQDGNQTRLSFGGLGNKDWTGKDPILVRPNIGTYNKSTRGSYT